MVMAMSESRAEASPDQRDERDERDEIEGSLDPLVLRLPDVAGLIAIMEAACGPTSLRVASRPVDSVDALTGMGDGALTDLVISAGTASLSAELTFMSNHARITVTGPAQPAGQLFDELVAIAHRRRRRMGWITHGDLAILLGAGLVAAAVSAVGAHEQLVAAMGALGWLGYMSLVVRNREYRWSVIDTGAARD